MNRNIIAAALLVISCWTIIVTAQHTENKADQTLRSTGRVNPSSLGMEIDIPLIGYPGRGISLPIGLNYSSKVWRLEVGEKPPECFITPCGVFARPQYSELSASGWTTSLQQPYVEYTGQDNFYNSDGTPYGMDYTANNNNTYHIKRISVHLFDGSSHELRASDSAVTANASTPVDWDGWYYAVDGSGIRYYEDAASGTYKIYLTDGSFYKLSSSHDVIGNPGAGKLVRKAVSYKDRHINNPTTGTSNEITFIAPSTSHPNGAWQDTLGRVIDIPLGLEAPTSSGAQDYILPGMDSQNPLIYKLHWKNLKGANATDSALTNFSDALKYPGRYYYSGTNYQQHDIDDVLFNSASGGVNNFHHVGFENNTELFNPVVLTAIELPNGQKYEFGYNYYGEINTIKYPTGGAEKFVYSQVEPLGGMNQAVKQTNRGVTSRNVYENAPTSSSDPATAVWSYSADVQDNMNNGQLFYRITTTAPDSSKTERIMHRSNQYPAPLWGFDDLLAGMPIEERSFSTTGVLLSRTLTSWTASTNRFARKTAEETIIYDASGSGSGLSTKTALEYDGDLSQIDAPLNVNRTTKYAFVPVSDGAISVGSAPVGSPTASATLTTASVTETDFLYTSIDPNLSALKTSCANLNMLNLPIATRVMNGNTIISQTKIGYDETNYSPSGRCNATSVSAWLDTTNSYLTTRTKYDSYGNVIETTDAKGNVTTTSYDAAYSYAYPTSVTTPVPDPTGTRGSNAAFTTTMTYNSVTGLVLTTTDANGQTTTMEYKDPVTNVIDPLLRLRRVIAPNGQQTITEYGVPASGQLPASQRFVKVKTQIDANNWKEGYTWFDGLARTVKTQSIDSGGDVFALTCYDAMGRVLKTSNPFRNGSGSSCSSTNLEWTTNTYDAAGRPWKVTTADNAFVETNYSLATSGNNIGTVVTITDQAGKQRRSITNALGQLTRVDEPDINNSNQLGSISAPNQPTYYEYDLLNNLTKVKQGGTVISPTQLRTFAYDSLSRLKSVDNPESGVISYTYDSNDNMQTKRDARGIKTIYDYDNLNRIIGKCYRVVGTGSLGATTCANAGSETFEPNTSDVNYYYDNLTNARSRLIKVEKALSKTEYQSFDQMGRVTQSQQFVGGAAYPEMTYTYNLSGAMIEQKYPSGRVVKNVLDNEGDLSIVQSKKNQTAGFWNYADNFTYTAAGAISSMQLGNGRWESTQFNSRLQPIQITLGSVQNGTDKLKLDFSYNTTGQNDNNGNVLSQTITAPTETRNNMTYNGFTATQVYTYDALNRLRSAEETIPSQTGWKQTFDYDRFGNRTFDEANTTVSPNFPKTCGGTMCTADKKIYNPQAQTSDNKFSTTDGYQYDDSGNTTRDAQNRKFTYDAENKQTKVETIDANGNSTSTIGEYFYDGDGKRVKKIAGTEVTIFIYDAAGKLVAEYANQITQTQTVSYLTTDHLGSPRINTDQNGNVTARHDYQPFGEEIQRASYGADDIREQFATYERDKETDLDFAQARYFNSEHGRFTVVDPYNIVLESQYETDKEKSKAMLNQYIKEPQQWNRYAYAINNPLKYTDPTGEIVYLTGTAEEQKAALERIKNLLGAERYSWLSIGTACDAKVGNVTVLSLSEEGMKKMDAIGRGDEGEFSVRMSDIFGSREVVEYRLAETFTTSNGSVKTTLEFGGGATLNKDESPTGRIQIFIHPTEAIKKVESVFASPWGRMKSSDGGALYFTNEIIDAHEFGHAHEGISGGLVDSTIGNEKAIRMENILRERQKGNVGPRRRKAH